MEWSDYLFWYIVLGVTCLVAELVAEMLCVNRDYEKLTWTRRPGGDESIIYEHRREGRTISVSSSSVNRGMVSAMGAGNGSLDARERQRRYAEVHRMYELEDGTSGRRKGRAT